jgi:hypothetical protein
MIRNDDELLVVREQLSLVEEALAALRRDVLPMNKRNYEILSEGYVDQIAALKAELDAYVGAVPDPHGADDPSRSGERQPLPGPICPASEPPRDQEQRR